jgi:hypothetical protein
MPNEEKRKRDRRLQEERTGDQKFAGSTKCLQRNERTRAISTNSKEAPQSKAKKIIPEAIARKATKQK